jgi:glycosyltransferase involved in cell wall biosynthesis
MRVGLTIEHAEGRKTGVGQYAFRLLQAILAIDRENDYVLFSPEPLDGEDRVALSAWPNLTLVEENPFRSVARSPALAIPLWVQFGLPRLARRRRLDLFFHTGVVWPIVPRRLAPQTWAFVHDLIQLREPRYFHRHSYYHFLWTRKANLGRFDGVLANSEATRRDLADFFPGQARRVSVTPLAADGRFHPVSDPAVLERVRAAYRLPERYVLFTGTIEPRKNLPRLISAFAGSRAAQTTSLVVAGKRGWMAEEAFERAGQLGIGEKVLFVGYVEDRDLAAVYSQARAFVYPSLYEGFGLPALEAMACGVPVIASNTSSLPEVAGNAALLVDPEDTEDLAAAIDRVVLDEAFARELSVASLGRASEFSWEATARSTLAALGIPVFGPKGVRLLGRCSASPPSHGQEARKPRVHPGRILPCPPHGEHRWLRRRAEDASFEMNCRRGDSPAAPSEGQRRAPRRGMGGGQEMRKGFWMTIRSIVWPCCMSSEYKTRQLPCSAAATISAS